MLKVLTEAEFTDHGSTGDSFIAWFHLSQDPPVQSQSPSMLWTDRNCPESTGALFPLPLAEPPHGRGLKTSFEFDLGPLSHKIPRGAEGQILHVASKENKVSPSFWNWGTKQLSPHPGGAVKSP